MDFHSTPGVPDTAIRLISGEIFDYADPDSAVITLHDVAHALARTSRFAGHHGAPHWTVAHHAILVADIVSAKYGEPDLCLAALHHDDVEFVTGDWPSPLKRYLNGKGLLYKELLERPIEAAICKALSLPLDDLHAGVVKDADRYAFVVEGVALKPEFNPEDQGFDDVDIDTEEFAEWVMSIATYVSAGAAKIERVFGVLDKKFRARLNAELDAQKLVNPPSETSRILDAIWELPPAETPDDGH